MLCVIASGQWCVSQGRLNCLSCLALTVIKAISNYDKAGWCGGDAHSLCLGGVLSSHFFFIGFPVFLSQILFRS